jgi:hypothetical protein
VSATGTSYTVSGGLTPGHSYTLYVGAASANGAFVAWSAGQMFSLGTYGNPTPTGPTGTIAVGSGYDTPTLTWNAVTGANHYLLYLADNAAPGSPILSYVPVTGTSYTVSGGLTPGHSYTWHVAAASVNGAYAVWSPGQSFSLATLAAPVLTGPTGTIATAAGFDTPTFSWTGVTGASRYLVSILDDTTGALVVNASVTGTSYTASMGLTPGHRFTATVAAASANGTAFWSSPDDFSLGLITPPTLVGG